jgi:hypothetical protein
MIRNDFVDPRMSVDSTTLDELIYDLSVAHPERGERMIIGYLRSRGIRITRQKVGSNAKIFEL